MKDNGRLPAVTVRGFRAPFRPALAFVLLLAGGPAAATQVQLRVVDAAGEPLTDAVVAVTTAASDGSAGSADPAAAGTRAATMAQQNQAFAPEILAISRGTRVKFPNLDDTQHHVYSFSPAKVFELPLYKGDTHEPVEFDKTGVVALGCNIHDDMRGYIFVADTPHVALTDTGGLATIDGVPDGDYELTIWHQRAEEPFVPEPLTIDSRSLELQRSIHVTPPRKPPVRGLKAWANQ
ncbi:MAG: methylamine utilization protein [Gammaproteobacteria bacterium]|nr:methylamine utilization protein [Gammaproteobacteria bacterium]